jgi:hypothetical protein
MIVAVCGYFSLLDLTPDVFLDRIGLPGSNDYAMIIARFCMFFTLTVGIPINNVPGRNGFSKLFFGEDYVSP